MFSFLFQITINTTNAQPVGQKLVAFTSRAAHFNDVMDVIFVTHLVERLTRLVGKRRDVRVKTQRDTPQPVYSITREISHLAYCDKPWCARRLSHKPYWLSDQSVFLILSSVMGLSGGLNNYCCHCFLHRT